MTLEVEITVENFMENGESESVKSVCAKINVVVIREYYTYPDSTSDSTIQSEVETDLTNKGYTW